MIGYRIPFVVGSALGVVSLVAAQWMKVPDTAEQISGTPTLLQPGILCED
jgi:predicted MFS family arabinose efflux permease